MSYKIQLGIYQMDQGLEFISGREKGRGRAVDRKELEVSEPEGGRM